MKVIGTDIGGTKVSVCLGESCGSNAGAAAILARSRFPTASFPGPAATLAEIGRRARALMAETGTTIGEIARIGISCAGPLDSSRGVVLSPPNMPGWDTVPVCEILQRELGDHATAPPARLENDANAAALAEWQFGAGRGTRHMVFLTCSTGMGGGLILDGRLYRGRRDLAGEVGHLRLTKDGPKLYDKTGSFEAWASGAGLALQTGRSVEELARAARAGDAGALAAITHAGEMLGRGIAILCDVLNPELVVCGTLAVHLGDLYLAPARRVVAAETLDPCPIVPAELTEDLPERAALAVALDC
jgi:glucokinase